MPLLADGATRLSDRISVVREDDRWTYFCGAQPVFHHAGSDSRSFRMFTAQLICQGACRQLDVVRVFGVSKNSVIRSVAKYRAGSVPAVYSPRAARRAAVLTPEVTARAQQLFAAGWSRGDVARVHLEVEAQADMTWVVVDDPIPAGSTVLGRGLGGDSTLLAQGEKKQGTVWPAFEERTFEGFRAYYRYVPKGKFIVEYSVRLNNPGEFNLPATRVEAMYAPEMFGELPNADWTVLP